MALRVWLPLNGSLENKGLSDTVVVNNNAMVDSAGKIGQCYSLASGNYLGLDAKNVNNHKYSPISLALWIYFTQTDSTERHILGCWESGGCGLVWQNQKVVFSLYSGSYKTCFSATTITLNVWHHVCATYDGAAIRLYIDGILSNSNTAAGTMTYHATCPWTIGSNPGATSFGTGNLTAKINDVRIYDNCLSAKEVKEIAQGLILHYKLNEIIGNNLLANSFEATGQSESAYMVKAYNLTENLVNGDAYTITAKLTASSEKKAWGVWVGGGSYIAGSMWQISKTTDVYTKTFTADANMADKTFIQVYVSNNSGTQGSTAVTGTAHVHWIKIEKGSVSTGWGPSNAEVTPYIPDSSGYDRSGIITGDLIPQTDSSRYLNAIYNANGTANRITTPTLAISKDAITLNIWFKSTNTAPTGDYHMLVDSNANRQWYEIAVHKTGYFRGGIFVNGTRYAANCSTTTLLNGNWHMLTLTYDGTAVKRYTDGVLESTSTVAISSGLSTPTALTLFRDGPNATYACQQASLSDFRIYATALSADDIADLYHTSANVDNLQQMHAFEFSENGNATKIYKNGIWETEKIISSTEGANLFSGNKTTDWRGITAKFDGEYLTLNGAATSALGGNAGTGFYLPITYEAGKQYSYIVSYVSGTATGSGWGIEYGPRGFSSIEINQDNYTTTQYVTRSVSTTTEESNGYSLYGWVTGTTYNNLVMKLQVIEGAYNPDGITAASVYSNKLQAVNFIEK